MWILFSCWLGRPPASSPESGQRLLADGRPLAPACLPARGLETAEQAALVPGPCPVHLPSPVWPLPPPLAADSGYRWVAEPRTGSCVRTHLEGHLPLALSVMQTGPPRGPLPSYGLWGG